MEHNKKDGQITISNKIPAESMKLPLLYFTKVKKNICILFYLFPVTNQNKIWFQILRAVNGIPIKEFNNWSLN